MPKRLVLTLAVFLVVGALVFVGGVASNAQVGFPQVIASDSPCPAVGCASGECHGFDNIPMPDGIHELSCPEISCSATDCHAWDTLVTRYYQPSDSSLNLWIIAPILLVVGLVLIVRKL